MPFFLQHDYSTQASDIEDFAMPSSEQLKEHTGQIRPRLIGYGGWEPLFYIQRTSSEGYLARERLDILKELPNDHNLKDRVHLRSGRLLSPHDGWPQPTHREIFTDEQLKDYKTTRRANNRGSDYDDANTYLQRSTLVQMWNADNAREEQWAEYDAAQASMEQRAKRCGVPDNQFDDAETVDRKRKRVVSPTHKKPAVRLKYTYAEPEELDDDVEQLALEEGEIHQDLDVVETIEKQNEQLRAENSALKAAIDRGLLRRNAMTPDELPSPPASPPESDDGKGGETESSDDGSMVVEPDDGFFDDKELEVEQFRRPEIPVLAIDKEILRMIHGEGTSAASCCSADNQTRSKEELDYETQFKQDTDHALTPIKEEERDEPEQNGTSVAQVSTTSVADSTLESHQAR